MNIDPNSHSEPLREYPIKPSENERRKRKREKRALRRQNRAKKMKVF